ncbi:MAG: hypothetical protein KKD39_01190 [Candidatus Altiarchaeota archaeon]|nr:hypothetical protein [Candidatus Altiarchaeota archaeon]
MIELQQPYTPVCLMTAAVMGTEYYHHLYIIRKFRDEILHNRLGWIGSQMSNVYYEFSGVSSELIAKNKTLKYFVLHFIVRPTAYLSRKILG